MKTETKTGKEVVTSSAGAKSDSVENKEGSAANPTVDTKMRPPREFPVGGFSKVSLNLGVTKSLGDYEFARIDVAIEEYCDPTPEARTKTFGVIQEEAKVVLGQIAQKIIASRKKGTLNG